MARSVKKRPHSFDYHPDGKGSKRRRRVQRTSALSRPGSRRSTPSCPISWGLTIAVHNGRQHMPVIHIGEHGRPQARRILSHTPGTFKGHSKAGSVSGPPDKKSSVAATRGNLPGVPSAQEMKDVSHGNHRAKLNGRCGCRAQKGQG